MYVIRSLAFVFVLMLTVGSLVSAHDEDGNRVRKTFTLTLHGDVPANEDFSVFISSSDPTKSDAGQMPYALLLCDPSTTHCESGGAVHTAFLTAQPGTKIGYTFAHNAEGPRADGSKPEYFSGSTEMLTTDSSTSVTYTYSENGKPGGFALANKGGQDGKVKKTFELTINGSAPDGEDFSISLRQSNEVMPVILALCHPVGTACRGNGTVYTAYLTAKPGVKIGYLFQRNTEVPLSGESDPEYFDPFSETLTTDSITSVTYTYGDDGEPQGFTLVGKGERNGTNPDMPTELPGTGAGGGRNRFPPTVAAIGLALLLASGFAVRRRYRAR